MAVLTGFASTWASLKTKRPDDGYNKCLLEVNRIWQGGTMSSSLYGDEIATCKAEFPDKSAVENVVSIFKNVSMPAAETNTGGFLSSIIGKIGGETGSKKKNPFSSNLVVLLISTIVIGFVVATLLPKVLKK